METGKIRDMHVVHYASADRSYYELMIEPLIQAAIASDATRKHSGTRADNAERSDVALFPEGIAGNRICEKNRCCHMHMLHFNMMYV